LKKKEKEETKIEEQSYNSNEENSDYGSERKSASSDSRSENSSKRDVLSEQGKGSGVAPAKTEEKKDYSKV
jgi:serine/threonine protein kinase